MLTTELTVPYVAGHGLSAARRHEIAIEDAWLRSERQRAAYDPCAPPRGLFRMLVDWFASCLAR
jgi:hypothetical protein